MHACILGWNAAAHRKAVVAAYAFGVLFWALVVIFGYFAVRVII
jgi:hypothetical protein